MKEINVSLGEYAISRNPEDVLVAYGLGSCMGVVMVDPVSHFAGLLHAVLPRTASGVGHGESNPFKYVESGIENLVATLIQKGADQSRLVVRIIGGANMLVTTGFTTSFDIGTRNIEAAHSTLSRLKLPIAAAEVGGHTGRTLRAYVANGRVTVRLIGEKEREI
jgi:chemotaxis protein CheD